MTRQKKNHEQENAKVSRKARVKKLIALGWIKSEADIPPDAIPVDPDRINLGGSWHHPTFYRDFSFTCKDCGASQAWTARDQRWYFESTGAPYYFTANRCRACRNREKQRKIQARISSGYANAKPEA